MKGTLILNFYIINENFLWLLVSIFFKYNWGFGEITTWKSFFKNPFIVSLLDLLHIWNKILIWLIYNFPKIFPMCLWFCWLLELEFRTSFELKSIFQIEHMSLSFDRFCFYLVYDTRNVSLKVINRCLFKFDLIFFFLIFEFWILKFDT